MKKFFALLVVLMFSVSVAGTVSAATVAPAAKVDNTVVVSKCCKMCKCAGCTCKPMKKAKKVKKAKAAKPVADNTVKTPVVKK